MTSPDGRADYIGKIANRETVRSVVLIGGTARSGTTVLDLMLGSSSSGFSCGEVGARFRPYRRHHLDPRCRCGSHPCDVWALLGDVPARQFHAAVADRLEARTVVDSSKSLAWVSDTVRWARKSGLHASSVLIWKEPKALAYSFYKRREVDDSIHVAMRNFIGYYSMAMSMRHPIVAVQNEHIRSDPAQTLRRISRALGVPYEPGQEEFWRFEHHHLFGSDSAATQSRAARPTADPTPTVDFERRWASLAYEQSTAISDVRENLLRLDAARAADAGPCPRLEHRYDKAHYVKQRVGRLAQTARLLHLAPGTVLRRWFRPGLARY